jgi:hypothetical protein
MPSRFAPPTINFQRQERQLAEQYLKRAASEFLGGSWEAFIPDAPHNLVGLNRAREMQGLVVRADASSSGEALTTDGGWAPVDPDRLGANWPGLDAASTRDIVLIRNFALTTDTTKEPDPASGEALQTIVLIAGDGATPGSFQMYRLDPSTAQWTEIPFDTTGLAGAAEPSASINGDESSTSAFNSMPDAAVFTLGAPARADGAGAIAQPAFLWTNNKDPVQVYPSASGNLEFQPLTELFAATGDFRCVSLATFNDRVYFLNTYENGIRHRYRLRRTARNTCDPQTTNLGAGYIDIEQFSGNGVSVRPLGNVMACYFEDGVCFVRDTGDQTSPNAIQILDVTRGLLSTHAVCNISNNQHFGIFDDGWWILDSNGRWQEVGVTTANGKPFDKWKSTFYGQLDFDEKHRIQCYYDRQHNWVRIAVPTAGSEITTVWIYDIDGDRVFPDDYSDGITVWGDVVVYEAVAELWSTQTLNWNEISATWASLEAAGDVHRMAHGNQSGYVYFHDDDFADRNGEAIPWFYQSFQHDFGLPMKLKSSERLGVEYTNSGNPNTVNVLFSDGYANQVSTNAIMNDGGADEIRTRRFWGTVTGHHLAFRIAGSGQVRLRQFIYDYFLSEGEDLTL